MGWTKAQYKEYRRKHYQDNKAKAMERAKKHYHIWRRKALAGYGNCCECCGETERNFLAIDHINGLTDLERETGRMFGDKLHRWLVANDFPSDFRILCHNCNMGRRFNGGTCPHEEQ